MVAGELIPITLFLVIGGVLVAWLYFRHERDQAGGGDYRRLAEEATRGQRALLEEIEEMNETLQEIERLLSEV